MDALRAIRPEVALLVVLLWLGVPSAHRRWLGGWNVALGLAHLLAILTATLFCLVTDSVRLQIHAIGMFGVLAAALIGESKLASDQSNLLRALEGRLWHSLLLFGVLWLPVLILTAGAS